ncbi:hypothetical protein [Thalassotalea fusca]
MPDSIMPISKDERIFTVFLQRFNRFFLPTLRMLKDKVERGEELEQSELEFLEQVFSATHDILPKIITNRKYYRIFIGAIRYYNDITNQALANAKANSSDSSVSNDSSS